MIFTPPGPRTPMGLLGCIRSKSCIKQKANHHLILGGVPFRRGPFYKKYWNSKILVGAPASTTFRPCFVAPSLPCCPKRCDTTHMPKNYLQVDKLTLKMCVPLFKLDYTSIRLSLEPFIEDFQNKKTLINNLFGQTCCYVEISPNLSVKSIKKLSSLVRR